MKKMKVAAVTLAITLIVLTIAVQPATANPGTRLDSLIDYLNNRYNRQNEGSFALKEENLPRAESTYAAATALQMLGYLSTRPPAYDLVRMKNFTSKLQWIRGINEDMPRYGSFAAFIAGPPSVATTYYATELWKIVNMHNDLPKMDLVSINETATLVYLNRTQHEEGGFGLFLHDDMSIEDPEMLSTFMGLSVMEYMMTQLENGTVEENWEIWLQNKTATIDWIMSCYQDGAFKMTPNALARSVTATAAAIRALDILDSLSSINPYVQDIVDFILDRQIEVAANVEYVGGFTEGVYTNDTNLVSTYYALSALDLLNSVDQVNKPIAIEFVVSCQAADGAWGFVPNSATGDTHLIAYAMNSLALLASEIMPLLLVEDPYHPSGIFIDWRILAVVVLFVIPLVLGFISMRMD